MNGVTQKNNGSVGSGNSSRGTSRQQSLQKGSRQASEDSAPNWPSRRVLHPAEKRAQQLRIPGGVDTTPHRMNTLRRLSRADFSSIRRAGK